MGSTGCYGCHAYPNEYYNEYMIILQDRGGRNYQLCEECITKKFNKYANIQKDLKNLIKSDILNCYSKECMGCDFDIIRNKISQIIGNLQV